MAQIETTRQIRIKSRVDESGDWQSLNPILLDREIGYERDTGKYKIGDGETAWNDLEYAPIYNISEVDAKINELNIENGTGNNSLQQKGGSNQATGLRSHAEGYKTEAISKNSHAEGYKTEAISENSHAEGNETAAGPKGYEYYGYTSKKLLPVDGEKYFDNITAENSTLIAYDLTNENWKGILDIRSISSSSAQITIRNTDFEEDANYLIIDISDGPIEAQGELYQLDIKTGHVEGFNSWAIGSATHSEGQFTCAIKNAAHSEGQKTIAIGNASHAEGNRTIAENWFCHAEGDATIAEGDTSHAEGGYTVAKGAYSHTEGYETYTNGDYSHTGGHTTYAHYDYNFAHGYGIETTTKYETAIGLNNTRIRQTSGAFNLFVIGNGGEDLGEGDSNALRITTDKIMFGVSTTSSGADYAELFEWQDKNVNNEIRFGKFVTLDGDKIKIANSNDDYILGIITANASMVGNSYEDNWNQKFLTDVYGNILYTEKTDEKTGKTIQVRQINPEYNSELKYIGRTERPEWAPVGMLGQLVVDDDGTCEINGYCGPNDDGIATKKSEGYRVIKRLDENHVLIIFK